ncbi:galactose-1-phosphate uridylyltransferase [Patescibacteria group bacterium]
MPELRQNPLTKKWVVIAVERSKRPDNFEHEEEANKKPFDPFVQGKEKDTPEEIYAVRKEGTKPNTRGWSIRVIPNLFPILSGDEKLKKTRDGMYTQATGSGAHELIITVGPERDEAKMTVPELKGLIDVFQMRHVEVGKDDKIKYVQIFKNHKGVAGASIRHPHHQLVGLPIVSENIQEELDAMKRYKKRTGRTILQDMIKQEKHDKKRVVHENKDFIVFCPFFSESPFEVWIAPKRPRPLFEKLSDAQKKSMADAMQCALGKMWNTLKNPPMNYFIHTAPTDGQNHDYFHWHVKMFPRITIRAGFEMGTGIIVNVVAPEEAAKFFRKASRKVK